MQSGSVIPKDPADLSSEVSFGTLTVVLDRNFPFSREKTVKMERGTEAFKFSYNSIESWLEVRAR